MPCKYWDKMATTDFSGLDPARTVVVMPVGSIEQHGPHLPLSVDIRITEGVLTAMTEHVPPDLSLLILPTLPVGKANEHEGFAGTLSVSLPTLNALWTEVAESVFRTGLKKLLILNGHGGQTAVAGIVARDLRIRHDALVVPANWWTGRTAPDVFDADEYLFGIHGGAEETSAMMHLHPDLVRKEQCAAFTPAALAQRDRFPRLFSGGVLPAWKAEDLNAAGACGNASAASAETGRRIIEDAAAALAELVAEMAAFPLPRANRNETVEPYPSASIAGSPNTNRRPGKS